jgi:hypothetical protein
LIWSAWVLVAWLLALRWLSGLPDDGCPWRSRVDVPLALGSGVVFAALTGLWFPAEHMAAWNLTASDFSQYCESVAAVQVGAYDKVHVQRSLFAALLPGTLARPWGVLGGLALAALVAQCVSGIALFLWARAVAGRAAGVAAILLGSAMGPLVLLSRTITFYPQTVAATLVASAGAALAARFRTLPALFAAGAGAGFVMLWDVRGVYWGLPALAVGMLATLGSPEGPLTFGVRMRRLPLRLLVLWAPVYAAWWAGYLLTPTGVTGLVNQTAAFVGDAVRGVSTVPISVSLEHDFIWGRSSPLRLPEVLGRVSQLGASLPAELARAPGVTHVRESWVLPWVGPIGGALLLCLLGLFRKPWQLVALVVPAVPYATALWSASMVLGHARYLAVGFPAVAVAAGVGFAVATRSERSLLPEPARAPVALGGLLLLVLGVVPGWLSTEAPWREPFYAEEYPRALQTGEARPVGDQRCLLALAADEAAGRSWWGYPALPAEQDGVHRGP